MSINLTAVEADVEEVADSALTLIPGNPAFAAPIEKAAVHWLLTYAFSFLQAKATALAAPPSAVDAVSAGAAAGVAAAKKASAT